MTEKLKCDMFGEEGSEEQNALMSALIEASEAKDLKDNDKIYKFLSLSKTTFIVFLLDALHSLGYKIVKK